MTIEELQARLESITGNTPIDDARRLVIMEMIWKLMGGGDG